MASVSKRPRSLDSRAGGDAFGCPFCGIHAVERLYVASTGTDTCSCLACGNDWDENHDTGRLVASGDDDASVIAPRSE